MSTVLVMIVIPGGVTVCTTDLNTYNEQVKLTYSASASTLPVIVVDECPNDTQNYAKFDAGDCHNNDETQINNDVTQTCTSIQRCTIEQLVQHGLTTLHIERANWRHSSNGRYHQCVFAIDAEHSDQVLQYFQSLGIGLRWDTSIGIIPFTLYYEGQTDDHCATILSAGSTNDNNSIQLPVSVNARDTAHSIEEKRNAFIRSITARLTVAQVVANVRENGTLTFNFVCYTVLATIITAMSLLENNSVLVVASMLFCPMLGPLMAITFGTVIHDSSLVRTGLNSITVCFAVCLMFGFFFGMVAFNVSNETWYTMSAIKPVSTWPTDLMKSQGLWRSMWTGTLVAFPCGCAVAVSLLSGNEASLVGVIIAVSLLPSCVNAGLLWAYAMLHLLYSIPQQAVPSVSQLTNTTIWLKPSLLPQDSYRVVYSDNMAIETAILGAISLLFTLVNIVNTFIGAILLLKIKEINVFSFSGRNKPMSKAVFANNGKETAARFFQEDIKIAREYSNKENHCTDDIDALGEAMLREWAKIECHESNYNNNNTTTDSTEQILETRVDTLGDIFAQVEMDTVYQTITRNNVPSNNLTRRLSRHWLQNVL